MKRPSNQSLHERLVLGLCFEGQAVSGDDVPFYGYPFLQLRGVPAMRYQDETAGAFECHLYLESRFRNTVPLA